jgi:hypothetical protein
MTRAKKEPVGWIGPSMGSGPGTSLGEGRWRVIDSQRNSIASGFTTQAYANRWIDSFNLLRAGHRLNDHDRKWLLLHWYYERKQTRSAPPTESSSASAASKPTADEAADGRWRQP